MRPARAIASAVTRDTEVDRLLRGTLHSSGRDVVVNVEGRYGDTRFRSMVWSGAVLPSASVTRRPGALQIAHETLFLRYVLNDLQRFCMNFHEVAFCDCRPLRRWLLSMQQFTPDRSRARSRTRASCPGDGQGSEPGGRSRHE